MLSQDYLGVRLVRLGTGQVWQPPNGGLFFFFALEGSGDYSDGKSTRMIQQGTILVLRQISNQNQFVARGSGMVFRCFSLLVEQMFPLFDSSEFSLLEDVIEGLGTLKHYPASTPQAQECRRLLEEVRSESNLEQRARVLAIVAAILSEEFKKARTRRPGSLRAEEHMEQVFETLSEVEFLSLSVAELASRFGCSRRHLTRLFRLYFGSSIGDFRTELRLMKVACLLRNPNIKITHIAQQCGFNHLGHFNARFKRRFGVSPGQWRKQTSDGLGEVASGGQFCQKVADILRNWNPCCDKPSTRPPASVTSHLRKYKAQLNGASSSITLQQVCSQEPANHKSKNAFELIGSPES